MAYHDYNGKITIDDTAAARDVRKIQSAIEKLNDAGDSMMQLMSAASEIKGNTGNAIQSRAQEQKRQLDALISNLNQTCNAINQTVEKYKRLDREVKAAIESRQ
jgi:type VII secretion effector (TIGR04197 family)